MSGNSQQPNQREIDDALSGLGPQEILAQFQRENEEYWRQHGLRMPAHHLQVSQSGRAPYQILPQIRYESKRYFQPLPAITFVTSTTNYVRLRDTMNGQLANLQRAEDLVFFGDDSLSQKQSLRLEIVGCRHYEKQINVRNPANNSRSITRAKLAEKVAKEIYDYMGRNQTGPLGDPSLGLGPGTRGFERIVLFELSHVSKSSWQPQLGLLLPQ
ncbi:hypothetical protein C8Q74DRAFT_1362716 [Fomes fomentarius]|nr:hypothetical protein C8Q74DRAFT_1362716 [Fomes fomentarius]